MQIEVVEEQDKTGIKQTTDRHTGKSTVNLQKILTELEK